MVPLNPALMDTGYAAHQHREICKHAQVIAARSPNLFLSNGKNVIEWCLTRLIHLFELLFINDETPRLLYSAVAYWNLPIWLG